MISFIITAAVVAGFFHFSFANISDLDSFYYIRLASLYWTRGFFNVEFPWLPYSAITHLSSSLWYGFGLFLIPFTYFDDLVLGIKVAGFVLAVMALSLYYLVMRTRGLKMAFLWPFVLFFSSPNVLSQFLMTRPQLISLAVSPILFSLLVHRPEPANRCGTKDATNNLVALFLTSFSLVWFHLNFVWLAALILVTVTIVEWIVEKRLEWRQIAVVLAAAVLGWLARPNPLGAAELLYIQVVQQLLERQSGVRLWLGMENLPLGSAVVVRNFIPFMTLWFLAILVWAGLVFPRVSVESSAKRILLWSSLALSVIFFSLTIFVGRRAYNLWATFGVIFIAGVFTYIVASSSSVADKTIRTVITYLMVGIFTFGAYHSISKTIVSMSTYGYPPDTLKSAALWLKENSQPGDIVFNVNWSHFSPMFFWNQKNYYVGGLDPIFQYGYDPKLYWKFHHIATSATADKTCAAAVCSKEMFEDSYEVIKRDFKAKYIIVGKRHLSAHHFFERDERFDKKLETGREEIYLIK